MPKAAKKVEEPVTPAVEVVPDCDHRLVDVMSISDLGQVMIQRQCTACGKEWPPATQVSVIKRLVGERF